jgi:hypothetical protein
LPSDDLSNLQAAEFLSCGTIGVKALLSALHLREEKVPTNHCTAKLPVSLP